MSPSRPIPVDEDLGRWRSQYPDVTPIADLEPRQRQTIVGVVSRMLVAPGESVTLRVADGSGEALAVWTGRSRLPGVMLGSAVRLTATVAVDHSGTWVLRNPAWTRMAEPFLWPT